MADPDEARRWVRTLPTDELVCMPFVDTDVPEELAAADAELARRGLSRSLVRALRRVAAVGLWWQVVDWDWASLGIFDVLFGYAFVVGAAGFALLLLRAYAAGGVLLAVAVLLVGVAALGWRLRRRPV